MCPSVVTQLDVESYGVLKPVCVLAAVIQVNVESLAALKLDCVLCSHPAECGDPWKVEPRLFAL